jgi:hypothetical protein
VASTFGFHGLGSTIVTKILTAKRTDELEAINDLIHDSFFEVDDISFDSQASTLSFKFELPTLPSGLGLKQFIYSSKTSPGVECLLTIHKVLKYIIEDTEKVGRYDFNIIEFDAPAKIVRIRTNIPIGIQMLVSELEISLEVT